MGKQLQMDDVRCGQRVTVRAAKIMFDEPDKFQEFSMAQHYAMQAQFQRQSFLDSLRGVPLEIVAVDLPFAAVRAIQGKPSEGGGFLGYSPMRRSEVPQDVFTIDLAEVELAAISLKFSRSRM